MSASTLTKFPGKNIPDETLTEGLLTSTAVSIVWAAISKGKAPYVSMFRKDLGSTKNQLEDLKKALSFVKDKQAVIFLDMPPEGFKVESLQPFTLLVNGEGKPSVTAFIEGVADAKDAAEKLTELMQEQFQIAKSDIPALVKRCREAKTLSLALGTILGDTGAVTLHFSNGETAQFLAQGEAGLQEEEWGSQTLSSEPDGPGADKEVETGEEEELTPEQQMERAMSGEEEPGLPPGQHVIKGPGKIVHPEGGTVDDTHERWSPKAGMREKDFLKAIAKKTDKVPANAFADYLRGKFFVLVPKQTIIKDLKELGNTVAQPKVPGEQLPERKVQPMPVPDVPKDVGAHLQTTFLKDRKIGMTDVNSDAIFEPTFLTSDETNGAFLESLTIPHMAATYGWSAEDIKRCLLEAGKKMNVVDFAVNWIVNQRDDAVRAHQKAQQRSGEDPAALRAAERQRAKDAAKGKQAA